MQYVCDAKNSKEIIIEEQCSTSGTHEIEQHSYCTFQAFLLTAPTNHVFCHGPMSRDKKLPYQQNKQQALGWPLSLSPQARIIYECKYTGTCS